MNVKVSIGMMVYNESENIAKTIESVLTQDFEDFELTISDNCSTDSTLEICEHYNQLDARITLIKNSENIGAVGNAKQLADRATGEYFVWVSGHDLWDPKFLSKSLQICENDPSVVLCYPRSVWFDGEERDLGTIGRGIDTRGLDMMSRFQMVLWGMGYGCPIYGLIRSSALKQTTLGTRTIAPDNIFLNELSLLGTFAYLDEPLQYVRKLKDYGSWDSYIQKIFNQYLSEFSASDLFGRMIYEYLKIIYKHVANPYDRNILLMSVVNCLFTKHSGILSALRNSELTQKVNDDWSKINTLIDTIQQSGETVDQIWQEYHSPYKIGSQKSMVIDGVFFQLYNTGIARVWKSLLEVWANTEFGSHIVILDRAGTAPKIEGISYYKIPAYDYNDTDADRSMLQQVCNDLGAELFISTYYTTPLETPSVFMGYDMIPEVLGADLNQPMWQEKRRAIKQASAYLTISEYTAKDLIEVYPDINSETVTVAHCGIQPLFTTQLIESVDKFRDKYKITKPYFILIGSCLNGYKNGILFWKAFNRLVNAGDFDLICTGAAGSNVEELKQYAPGSNIHHLRLDDHELNLAYAGATALVYPSKYEGFGLPIVEAFASGCPVITCPNASIPEVAGDAAIYVFDDDIDGMTEALYEVQKPHVRAALIAAGLEQVKQFSWTKMGDIVRSVLVEQTLTHLQLGDNNLITFPDWSQNEEELGNEIATVCHNLAQSSDYDRPTLLIDTTNAEDLEFANMLVSGIVMNLMMNADIDITEHLEIVVFDKLSPIQWQMLLPKLHGRIQLKLEDMSAVESSEACKITVISEGKMTYLDQDKNEKSLLVIC
jgi:glycosyltransferase involved in cell wall biosynthesis